MISVIYANRNRSTSRIKQSLISLKNQSVKDFEVILVDYGSTPELVAEYAELLEEFNFLRFFSLKVPQLLWNKSKALNFGIKQTKMDFVFVADVDLIFHPDSIQNLNSIASRENFFLFPLFYLSKAESLKLRNEYNFAELNPERKGTVNGMILSSTAALNEVWGLDEFFHFYGAEDEDLFARLENAGYAKKFVNSLYFYHNWHPSFSAAEDKVLTLRPRVRNIMRINQQHFLRNRERGVIKPLRQKGMGEIIKKEESELLKTPSRHYQVYNIRAKVEHFLKEELSSLAGEIVAVEFLEDPYYRTWKHKIKKLLGKQSQPYCSLKEVNDILLKEIVFRYRDHNYSFNISEDLSIIQFRIQL